MKASVKKMRIWFEITNSPHINMFLHIIKDLQKKHEVLITCRPLANTVELLDLHGLSYQVVGKHYGKSFINKLIGFPVRVLGLIQFSRRHKPDVAINQSSFQQPVSAWLTNVPCIYTNDNEHALGNIPSFLFADKILIPEFLNKETVKKQFAKESKIIKYPGLKEGIYLWRLLKDLDKEEKQREKKTIFFRPEPRTAQYYKGNSSSIEGVLIELKEKFNIIISPRDEFQKQYYKNDKFTGITVLDKPLNLTEIIKRCDLFIGAGGTMSREMAIAGIPSISIYNNELLEVDKYLINRGILMHKNDIDASFVEEFICSRQTGMSGHDLLTKGQEAEKLIKDIILETGKE
jgi:predicted glycosyltransferase